MDVSDDSVKGALTLDDISFDLQAAIHRIVALEEALKVVTAKLALHAPTPAKRKASSASLSKQEKKKTKVVLLIALLCFALLCFDLICFVPHFQHTHDPFT